MLFYGVAKVIPTQMPEPPLQALLRPYGELSPASVLWLQVGSSHPYEMMLGSVEVLGGLLLFLPRTATLGALVGVASMAQVFMLNMTYDVPVKLLSFHLLLIGIVLLAPQMRRRANILVLQRPSEPTFQPPVFTAARANRVAAWVPAGLARVRCRPAEAAAVRHLVGDRVPRRREARATVDNRPKPLATADFR
jgi:hypothetical protein